MADKVTVEMLKKASMVLVNALDGDRSFTNSYRCREYPELTKLVSGSKRRFPRVKEAPKVTIYVDGIEVPSDYQAMADAINELREVRADGK
jgi:hypothetical protein